MPREMSWPRDLARASKHEAKGFKCRLCPAVYSFSSTHRNHTKFKHTEVTKEYKCNICEKKVYNASDLKKHISSIHHKIKYPCQVCKNEFANKFVLNRHIKNEHSNQTFKCELCNKVFKDSSSVGRHSKNVHQNNPSEFECKLCDRVFKLNSSFRDHVSFQHEGKREQCLFCDKMFESRTGCLRHQKTHHETKFECNICNYEFTSKNRLNIHVQLQHTKSILPLANVVSIKQEQNLYIKP